MPPVAILATESGRRDVLQDQRRPQNEEETMEALFPKDRERPLCDFTPRWRAEDWVTVKSKPGGRRRRAEAVRARRRRGRA